MLKQTNKKVNEQPKQTHRYIEQSSAYQRGKGGEGGWNG